MEVRLEKLKTRRTLHTYGFSNTLEEDAGKKMMELVKSNGLIKELWSSFV
jgi:hypothetical protein